MPHRAIHTSPFRVLNGGSDNGDEESGHRFQSQITSGEELEMLHPEREGDERSEPTGEPKDPDEVIQGFYDITLMYQGRRLRMDVVTREPMPITWFSGVSIMVGGCETEVYEAVRELEPQVFRFYLKPVQVTRSWWERLMFWRRRPDERRFFQGYSPDGLPTLEPRADGTWHDLPPAPDDLRIIELRKGDKVRRMEVTPQR